MSAAQKSSNLPLKSKTTSSKGAIIVIVSLLVLGAITAVISYLVIHKKKTESEGGGTKTQCKQTIDCGATTPVCWQGTCVQCTSDTNCGNGRKCNTSSHRCESAPCTNDADCASGQRCNVTSRQCESNQPTPTLPCSQECNWPFQKLMTLPNGTKQCVNELGCQGHGLPWLQTNTNVKLTTLQRGGLSPPQFLSVIDGQLRFVPDSLVTGSNTNLWYIDTLTNPGATHILQVLPDGTRAANPLMITYCGNVTDACLKVASSSASIQADPVTGFLVIRADHNLASAPQPSLVKPPEDENKLYAYPVPLATMPIRPAGPDYPGNFVPADHVAQSTWYSMGRGAAP